VWGFRRTRATHLGRWGEDLAIEFLKRRGVKILARNYRCPVGEIDLIGLDRSTRKEQGTETIAIIEVKTRSSDDHVAPESSVNPAKRRRMRKIAKYYLNTRHAEDFNVRFDVLTVIARDAGKPEIKYIPDAFC